MLRRKIVGILVIYTFLLPTFALGQTAPKVYEAPKEVSESVLLEIEKFMDEGCELRIFQYAHGYYLPPAIKLREFLRNRYGKSKRSPLILKNVPPAFTLTWSSI